MKAEIVCVCRRSLLQMSLQQRSWKRTLQMQMLSWTVLQ